MKWEVSAIEDIRKAIKEEGKEEEEEEEEKEKEEKYLKFSSNYVECDEIY